MTLEKYPNEGKLCVYETLSDYLRRTENIRNDSDKVFISYLKPHKEVCKSTISRWIKTFLGIAGIDITIFSAHSTRAASSSAAKASGVPVGEILRKAGWSSEKTFSKFYDLNIA